MTTTNRGPSPHLSWAELACRDGTPYPSGWRHTRALDLARLFESIRSFCGDRPITVLSGYRTPVHNQRIDGARFSQHLEGRALDLRPPEGWSVGLFYDLCRALAGARTWGIRGLGRYQTFVHVDLREAERLIVWTGHGIKDSVT